MGGGMAMGASAPSPIPYTGGPQTYEAVVQQTPAYNSTVYVGNLVPYCTQADLIPLFQSIGYLSEIRMQADRGFAFVKLDTHEHAAMAIVQLQGQMVHGRPIKCSWGKDRADGAAAAPMSPVGAAPAAPYSNMPMYGIPQAQSYGQYGYQAYPGAVPGAPGGAPGAGGLSPGGAGGGDLNASAQAAQAAWAATDPNAAAYYQNYWSGYYAQTGQQPGAEPGRQQ